LARRFELYTEFLNLVTRFKSPYWYAHCEKLLFDIPRSYPCRRLTFKCHWFVFYLFVHNIATVSSWSSTPGLPVFWEAKDLCQTHEVTWSATSYAWMILPPRTFHRGVSLNFYCGPSISRVYAAESQGSLSPTRLVDSNRSSLRTSVSLYADRPNMTYLTRCYNIIINWRSI
jgi:hypothetical protein